MTQSSDKAITTAPTAKAITKKPSVGYVASTSSKSEQERNSLTSARSLFDKIVHVKVGPEAVLFEVHRGLLCYQSAYFHSCLNNNFKEAREGAVTLDDEDPETFKRFYAWLYTGKLLYDGETVEEVAHGELFHLYIFAEKRLAPRFQDAWMDAVISKDRNYANLPVSEDVQEVWDNVCGSSPMRKYLVDLYVRTGDLLDVLSEDKKIVLSKELLASIIRALYPYATLRIDQTGFRVDFWELRCQYHTHEDSSGECV